MLPPSWPARGGRGHTVVGVLDLSRSVCLCHSSTLVWKIPWMEELGGLQSMGLLRVGHI